MQPYAVGDEPIPGYRLTRFLGVGGYGQVWEANGPGGIDIALKVLNITGTRGGKELRGVGLVKKLRHPNLVPLYAYWVKDEFGGHLDGALLETQSLRGPASELIIAMGLGDKSLSQRLEEVKKEGLAGIPLEELLNYISGAAKALDFLSQPASGSGQSGPIQHCDIKPANLLIVGNEVQVCDYGLARAISPDVRATAATGAGTQAYSAPEFLGGRPSDRTDQYSLAISYYELRTGQLPFVESAALVAHIRGELNFGLVEPAEQDVLKKAAHVQPEQRYAKAGDFVQALREATKIGSTPGLPIAPASSSTPSVRIPILDDKIRAGAELVPEHELVALLGRGGFGEVWKAVGPGGLPCALKIVRNLEGTQGKQEYRSLDLVRELDHERLIRLRAYWLLAKDGSVIPYKQLGQPGSPDPHALVMATDLADKSLLQYWQEKQKENRGGIGVADLVRITRQSAEAIDYLNDRDILHRDIKPENILLTKDLKVKVSDFGLAKWIEGSGAAIHQASVGLTLAYAAPEMFDNRVTRWTDQYALALTYYRLRTGNFPFPNDFGPRQMMLAHTEGRLEFAGIRPEEERVLRKATSHDPQGRFPNCISMVEALEQAHGMSSPQLGMTTTSRPGEFRIPTPSSVQVGMRTPADPRRTLVQDFNPNVVAATDSKTEAFTDAGGAVTAASDSEIIAELAKSSPLKTTPGSDLQATVIPDMLQAPKPKPKPKSAYKPVATPELDLILQQSPTAKRKRMLVYGGGLVVAAGIIGGAAHFILNRPPSPSSSSPASTLAQNNNSSTSDSNDGKSGTKAGGNDNKSGGKPTNDGKANVSPIPTQEDIARLLETKVAQEVQDKLKERDFAGAAKAIQDARQKKAAKDWADQQDDLVRAAWKAHAAAAGSPEKEIAELDRLLAVYKNDADAKSRQEAIRTEVANKASYEKFRAALKEIDGRHLDKARTSLTELSQQPIPSVLQTQIGSLLAKLKDYDADLKLPATLSNLDQLADKFDAFTKSSAEEFKPLPPLYRDLWNATVQKLVPTLDVAAKADDLVKSMSRLKTPWGEMVRAEAVTELLRAGKRVPDAQRALPTNDAIPDLEAYRGYVAATRNWVEKKDDPSADAIAALAANSGAAPWQNASRKTRLAENLMEASDGKRQRIDPAVAFSDANAAYRWLAAAEKLTSAPSTTMKKDQLLRMRLDLALAALTKPERDLALGRKLTDALTTRESLEVLQLPVPDLMQLWVMHARARDGSAAGRAAAAQSLDRALELVRDDLAGVPIQFVANEIVRPLDRDGGKSILGEPVADTTKAPAARLAADAARHLRRHWNDWAKELGKDDSPPDMAYRLFDRAATLDPKAEYIAWRGLTRFERPRFGASELESAALDAKAAITADAQWSGGHTLSGSVDAERGKARPDVRDRVELCQAADRQFKKAEELAKNRNDARDELVLLYQRAGNNDIQLANLARSAADKRTFLASAKTRADQLLALDPKRLEIRDTAGCALEDMAWLLRGPNRFGPNGQYAQAIEEFTQALGGFGERATPWMHRGRCKFKWAEDSYLSKAGPALDENLLRDAQSDLAEAANRAGESVEAIEARFWQAKIDRLRYRATDWRDPKRTTLHGSAVGQYDSALRLARELKNEFWAEPIAQEWAVAALEEASRLTDLKAPGAPAAVAAANRSAEELKVYSAPWSAYLRMLILPLEKKPDSAAYFDELTKRADAGLGNARQQDRQIQYMIHMRRAEERAFLSPSNVGVDGEKALADAQAASKIAIDAPLGDAERAAAIGMMGLARMRLFIKTSGTEKETWRAKARDDFRNALQLAPDHPSAWQWKTFLGIVIDKKEKLETPAEVASHFAELYRDYREAEQEAPPPERRNGHERYVAEFAQKSREDLEKNAPARFREALKADPNNPARVKWQLALAEMSARAGDAERVAEAKTLLDAATTNFSAADKKAHALQIERIKQALAKK